MPDKPEIILMKPDKPVSQMTPDERRAFAAKFVAAMYSAAMYSAASPND